MEVLYKYVVVQIMISNKEALEQRNVILQKKIFDMRWSILKCIDLLEADKKQKALKILKKVLYE